MAISSTVFVFEIDLSDTDRHVYETLSLRIARHPSESDEFLVARLLAYCLEFTEGIEFSKGLSAADDPPIAVRDLTGTLRAWIDVGTPSVERLHRASKAAPRVAVYVHKEHRQWLAELRAAKIHRAETDRAPGAGPGPDRAAGGAARAPDVVPADRRRGRDLHRPEGRDDLGIGAAPGALTRGLGCLRAGRFQRHSG